MNKFEPKFNIDPYQFEPTFPEGEELLSSSDSSQSSDYEEELEESNSRQGTTEWCHCENCIDMNTYVESVCCQELDVLNEKFDDSGVECITDHPKFGIVCLDSDVLGTALVAIHNARCTPKPDVLENRSWRLAAYRQFTSWTHGYLGKKNRRPIPSCVVKIVRDCFPEESGVYVGFKEAEVNFTNQ